MKISNGAVSVFLSSFLLDWCKQSEWHITKLDIRCLLLSHACKQSQSVWMRLNEQQLTTSVFREYVCIPKIELDCWGCFNITAMRDNWSAYQLHVQQHPHVRTALHWHNETSFHLHSSANEVDYVRVCNGSVKCANRMNGSVFITCWI